MPTTHAILAPSASKRWMTCAPSARLESREPAKDTAYTREGTIAHAIAEALLSGALRIYKERGLLFEWPEDTNQLNSLGGDDLLKCFSQCEGEGLDPDEMLITVSDNYARFIWEDYLDALSRDPEAALLIEAKLKLDEYIPDGFGSSDAVIIYGRTLCVYDLKYGKGVKVSAVGNTQMRCYALGALLGPAELYDITEVSMVIIQPRLQWVSNDIITADKLLDWAKEELKPAAVAAYLGEGPYVPGDHCRFCAVAPRCKALARKALDIDTSKGGDLMSDEDISGALSKAPAVEAWLSALKAYALDKALSGHRIPGFKVVEGRSIRTISDPARALEILRATGLDETSYVKPRELKTITDLERLLTKKGFASLLGDLVVKPQGKPTLVEESDPRPEMNNAQEDFKEYES